MKIVLTAPVWDKMRAYVDNCEEEISGLGKIERDEDGNFVVTDLALFQQTVSATHSDITAEALAKFQVELIKKDENPADWSFWWHSHAKMKVFFSGTDTATIDSSTDFQYLVSLVTNHAHDLTARVDTFQPVRLHADLDVEIEEWANDEIIEACIAEIKEKVSIPAPSMYKGMGYGHAKGRAPYQTHVPLDDLEWAELPTPKNAAPDYMKRADVLDEALTRVGTNEYAEAIDIYYSYRDELEIEVDLCVEEGDKIGEKEAKRKYFALIEVGRRHSLESKDAS